MLAAAVWIGTLARTGSRQRNATALATLLPGAVLWVPQVMCISLRMSCWIYVWIDFFSLACMLPQFAYLYFVDGERATA